MASNAFDNTSRGPSEIQTPSNQPIDMNRLAGGERNIRALCATMSMTENINPSSMNLPDLEIYHHDDCDANATPADAPQTKPVGTDTPAAQGDQAWKSHLNDQWVKDSLKDNPDWHAMEGLHPGEIAVGNWEPSKEEKKIIGSAVDTMMAENNNGPVFVTLPDGSLCKIEIVQGGHGQSFSKDKDKGDVGGRKHRKVSFGRPAPTDDSDSEICGDETDITVANPMDQTKTC